MTGGARIIATAALAMAALAFDGCKSATAPAPAVPTAQTKPALSRPAVTPPSFKVFHKTDNSITLVTREDATDVQVSAIIWELRDAARDHAFDKLGIDQKMVDARDPIIWFHLYRGRKCASEKYSGKLPCGAAYHAAGDFTLGGFKDHNHAEGALLKDENHLVELWDSTTP